VCSMASSRRCRGVDPRDEGGDQQPEVFGATFGRLKDRVVVGMSLYGARSLSVFDNWERVFGIAGHAAIGDQRQSDDSHRMLAVPGDDHFRSSAHACSVEKQNIRSSVTAVIGAGRFTRKKQLSNLVKYMQNV
jgi:hypothetical protein